MQQQKQLRSAYIELLKSTQPNLAITLDQGRSMKPLTFQSTAAHFMNCVQRKARGRAWTEWPKSEWPVALGFLEHEHTNPHMHLAVRAPAELVPYFMDAEPVWRKIRPCGADYYCEAIEDVDRYARYITKTFYRPFTHENVFTYL